jgi:hypothetical protein
MESVTCAQVCVGNVYQKHLCLKVTTVSINILSLHAGTQPPLLLTAS